MQIAKEADSAAVRLPRDEDVGRRRFRNAFRPDRVSVFVDSLEITSVEAEVRFVLTRQNGVGLSAGRNQNASSRKRDELSGGY